MISTAEGAVPAPTLALQPLHANVSFRNQAYTALKQAIMDADIYSHREELRLDERQLSRALGVSRTPIREAMTLLEQEGFLRTVPRRGVFIVRKTKKEIIEMIEVWAALESMAARLATVNASEHDIGRLRHMFDKFHRSTPAEHLHGAFYLSRAAHDRVDAAVARPRHKLGRKAFERFLTLPAVCGIKFIVIYSFRQRLGGIDLGDAVRDVIQDIETRDALL